MSGAELRIPVQTPEELTTVPPPAREDVAAGASAGSATHNRAVIEGVVWQGAMRWLAQVLSWTVTIVVARRLSPEAYGLAGTATVLFGFLTILTEGGIGRALMMRRDRDPELIRQAHGASLWMGVVGMLLMAAIAYPLSVYYREPDVVPLVLVLSGIMLLSGANAVPMALLQQRLEYRRISTVEFTKAAVQASTVLAFVLLGFGYWSLVIGLIAGYVSAFLLLRTFASIMPARPRRAALAPTLEYARHLVVGALAWYAYSHSDFTAVGRAAGLAALGYYQFAWNIAQLPGEKLANVLQAVVGPFFGSIGDDRTMLRHYFLVLSELMASVMLPVLTGFALVSQYAIPLIFGDKWLQAIPLVQILILCAALQSVVLLTQHVLNATGQAGVASRMNLWALLIMPAAFFLAAKYSGPVAVAWVWIAAQPVLMGIPLGRVHAVIGVSVGEFVRGLRAPLLCSAGMGAVVMVLQFLLRDQSPIVLLAAMSVAGAVTYVSLFTLFFRERIEGFLRIWRER